MNVDFKLMKGSFCHNICCIPACFYRYSIQWIVEEVQEYFSL